MTVLRSYMSGAWTGPADGRPVLDAVTGEEVARVSSDGIDLGAALAYGRGTGGPALRALTFHQRAGLIVASGLLPEGSIQRVCGSIGGLFEHLGEQDMVSFTGSAATARQLRAHPAVVGRSVRFNAEADSLNCSVLGPDAGPGTPEFDLYVGQLVTEMTVKAGQE